MTFEKGDLVKIVKYNAGHPDVKAGDVGRIVEIMSDVPYPFEVYSDDWAYNEAFEREQIQRICKLHNDSLVHHDTKEEWICPFCDIE